MDGGRAGRWEARPALAPGPEGAGLWMGWLLAETLACTHEHAYVASSQLGPSSMASHPRLAVPADGTASLLRVSVACVRRCRSASSG